jgi:hypothetical protein
MRSLAVRSKLENILHSLDTKAQKSTAIASNQVRELRSLSQLVKISVKKYFLH